MRVLSLFSGIGGFDLGLERAGMEIVGQVEIDPYCQRQLARHWPEVPRFDDVRSVTCRMYTRVDGASRAFIGERRRFGQPDLVCGGFPCQDVSVAGKRAGLDGDRSGLWFEFQRILRELRPRWALIENVPGLLSSNQGRDFAVILDGLGECGFGGIAWAVLDSQHFGVAQRRRRVFIVGGSDRRSVEQILSLCESCGGHPQTGRAPGQDVANTLGGGSAESQRGFRDDLDTSTYIPALSGTLNAHDGDKWGANQWVNEDKMFALRTAQTGANGIGVQEDVAYTLDGANGQAVAWAIQERAVSEGTSGPDGIGVQEEIAYTMEARPKVQMAAYGAAVRRLTPVECCRLQGFPDDWLDGADGPRYRALGNAVSVPVIEYLGRRIMEIDR